MPRRVWTLNTLETPKQDGIYEVRVCKKNELLDCPLTMTGEFKNGEWVLKPVSDFKDHRVIAWRDK